MKESPNTLGTAKSNHALGNKHRRITEDYVINTEFIMKNKELNRNHAWILVKRGVFFCEFSLCFSCSSHRSSNSSVPLEGIKQEGKIFYFKFFYLSTTWSKKRPL